MIAPLLLVVLGIPTPPEIPFRFRQRPQAPSEGGLAVEVEIESAARVDLLVESDTSFPRWERVDGADVESRRVVLRGPAGARSLIVVRRDRGSRNYELEGPFPWPSSATLRIARSVPRRTLSGARSPGQAGEMRLLGNWSGEPLCEIDPAGAWQCPAVPPDFSGRILACDGERAIAAATVAPGSSLEIPMPALRSSAIVRVRLPETEAPPTPPVVRVLRRAGSGATVLAPDSGWKVESLGNALYWLEGEGDPEERAVEIRASAFATSRVPLSTLRSGCVDPVEVALVRSSPIAGQVRDGSGRPVGGAVVLVRPEEPDPDPAVVADASTDEDGAFEIPDLEPRSYRLRVCHSELGCEDAVSAPGERVRITLAGGTMFIGRVLTRAGVPEPSARVRIVPTLEAAARDADRSARPPLVTACGGDGRFRIAAPEAGDYLLEIRSESSGAARIPVRLTPFSPRITDVGDVHLPDPLEIAVRVSRCGRGVLSMSGPLGGETPLPTLVRFPLDDSGAALVHLPEGGAWTAWATCTGRDVFVDPSILPDAAALSGAELVFEPAGTLGDQSSGRSK